MHTNCDFVCRIFIFSCCFHSVQNVSFIFRTNIVKNPGTYLLYKSLDRAMEVRYFEKDRFCGHIFKVIAEHFRYLDAICIALFSMNPCNVG